MQKSSTYGDKVRKVLTEVKGREFAIRLKLSISKDRGSKVISEVRGICSTEEIEYFQGQRLGSDK